MSVPLHQGNPTGITKESLVRVLEILYRLASPEALPVLLHEIIEVGKAAIMAEGGVLWLLDPGAGGPAEQLVMVVPAAENPARTLLGRGPAGDCAASRRITNVADSRNDEHFRAAPVDAGFDVRSLLNVPILGRDKTLLGVMQWLGAQPGQFDRYDEWIAPALAAQAAVAIEHSRMTNELLAATILEQEVAVARQIQMSTLPEAMPAVPGYDLHGRFLPTDHTGGDLFDLALLDAKLFMLLGDATGHGFGPALSATQMQAMLRVAFRCGADLDRAYRHVNNQLNEDLPDDRFITAFVGFLDPDKHHVNFHSGGQGPILHFHAADGWCEWHKPTSFPLGVMEMDDAPPARNLALEPGDVLALLSDGIYEFAAPDGSQFGEEGVASVIRQCHGMTMAELSDRLVEATFTFGQGSPQADDITLLLIRRLPRCAAAGAGKR